MDRRRRGPSAPLLFVVAISLALGLAVAAIVVYVGWLYVLQPNSRSGRPSTGEVFELIRIALIVTGGVGGIAALVVALRKQRVAEATHLIALKSEIREEQRILSERFVAAARLLGDKDSAAVRLAGVYAVASVADDWLAERQTCIELLCGYLRLPYDLAVAPPSEKHVRASIMASLADHLQGNDGRDWSNHTFNLEGATFENERLNGLRAWGCRFILNGAKILTGGLILSNGRFNNCRFELSRVELQGEALGFDGSWFQNCEIQMCDTSLSGGRFTLRRCLFDDSSLDFEKLRLSGGEIRLEECSFNSIRAGRGSSLNAPVVKFTQAQLTAGSIHFSRCTFGKDEALWRRPTGIPVMNWIDCTVDGATLDFSHSVLTAAGLRFDHATVQAGELRFDWVKLGAYGTIDFSSAQLIGGSISFDRLQMVGVGRDDPERQRVLPAWLEPLSSLTHEQRRDFYRRQLREPRDIPRVDLSSARLAGSLILFREMNGQDGVIDFSSCQFGGSRICFTRGHFARMVLMLHHVYWLGKGGKIEFGPLHVPTILLGNDLPCKDVFVVTGELGTAMEDAKYTDWPNVYIINDSP